MNYYPFHIGDYASATRHLSWDEDSAFRRLLDVYYTTEKPLPADLRSVCRLVLATTDAQRAAVELVLAEFFKLTPEGWINVRADIEIERMQDKQAKARASAAISVSVRKTKAQAVAERTLEIPTADVERTLPEIKANVELPTPTPTPTPTPKEKEKEKVADSPQSVDPPPPPPAFDGNNAQKLNCKAVVAIAAGWELPEDWGVDAEALGWQQNEVLREAEKFRQYWVSGKGSGKRRSVKGWRQSWSTWLGKAAERRP